MAEVMSVLFFHTMRYKITEPRSPHSDRFILSKGHAAPILYAGEGRVSWASHGKVAGSKLWSLLILVLNVVFI